MSSKLTKKFAAVIARVRDDSHVEMNAIDKRAARGFTTTSKKKFLKELDKRLNIFAEELPQAMGKLGREDILPLPAKIHFNKGALSVWRGPRKPFDVDYEDLRQLDGMKQIVKMAKAADVSLNIQLFAHSPNAPSRDLVNACAPTAAGDKPWTMRHDLGAFTDLYITVNPAEKFEKSKFPKKLQKPEAASAAPTPTP